ncbi:MAG TPA: DinB family protein [Cyclobacteriaceae bacterium]
MMEWAIKQYELVMEAREVIFDFCESMSPHDYTNQVDHFGQGNIRKTQAHIVDAYIHWIANFALNKSIPYLKEEQIPNVDDMRSKYANVNSWMAEFLEMYTADPNSPITNTPGRQGQITTTPIILFTHMITHEFHHKGQMVSMARILGYPPPDTDIIRL